MEVFNNSNTVGKYMDMSVHDGFSKGRENARMLNVADHNKIAGRGNYGFPQASIYWEAKPKWIEECSRKKNGAYNAS